ncbi:MAG: hypothetical protein JWN52_5301 [Actinomycetia bacterium]|jgi:hypothetical protein|nr:hypothetical protein [Actinomycetes bacterium]
MAIDAGLGHELGDAATLLAIISFWTGRWNEVFREEFTASLSSCSGSRSSPRGQSSFV